MWKSLDCSMQVDKLAFKAGGYQKPRLKTFEEGMLCSGSAGGVCVWGGGSLALSNLILKQPCEDY